MYVYVHALEAAAPTVFMGLATDLMHIDNFTEIHKKKKTACQILFRFIQFKERTPRQSKFSRHCKYITGWTIKVLELRFFLLTPVADRRWDLPSVPAIRYCVLYPRG